jgi:threonine/homoserine/homoserine lactone efflux protein
VFFLLLETSIRKGIRAALAFDIGVFISDLIYIALAYIFYNEVSKAIQGEWSYIFQIAGGCVFVIIGLINLFKKPKHDRKEEQDIINSPAKDYIVLGLKGFILNFANPGVLIYWIGVIGIGAKAEGNKGLDDNILLYLAIILITFFSMDLLKIVGAKKLRPFITDKVLSGLNTVTGFVIGGSGLYLIIKGIHTLLM